MRPGWVRLNFNYFISDDEFDYLLRSLELVAKHGWRMLPYYQLDGSSNWCYRGNRNFLPNSLESFSFLEQSAQEMGLQKPDFRSLLESAYKALTTTDGHIQRTELHLPFEAEELRWFALPQECFKSLTLESSVSVA